MQIKKIAASERTFANTVQAIDEIEGRIFIINKTLSQWELVSPDSAIRDACHEMVRTEIDHAEEDRIFANDIKIAHSIITSKRLLNLTYSIAEKEKINLKGPYYELFGIH